jgi:hypothetical protein
MVKLYIEAVNFILTIFVSIIAVLNFVGGKNIMIPSEKANKKDASNICGTKGLELMSFDSLTQLDAVQDFMGDIGIGTC